MEKTTIVYMVIFFIFSVFVIWNTSEMFIEDIEESDPYIIQREQQKTLTNVFGMGGGFIY